VEPEARTVRANGLQFGLLEAGEGPLALCLHGFPDTAHTWRYLLPGLAGAGFHAVAAFMRGYAPSGVPDDGNYSLDALAGDVLALHEALGGDEDSVLIGHDWGAEATYGAAARAPHYWRRLVTLAVPPAALDPVLFTNYEQLKRFFYLFFFRDTDAMAEQIVAADEMRFLEQLWQDWSPGFDATDSLAQVRQSLGNPANLSAAIGYYREAPAAEPVGNLERDETGGSGNRASTLPPTLYLHGSNDGCIGANLIADAIGHLGAGSTMKVIKDSGHFLHLEKPEEVNRHILAWILG
jgi:pimeloyl-ACP methyl ester carboxylesterase